MWDSGTLFELYTCMFYSSLKIIMDVVFHLEHVSWQSFEWLEKWVVLFFGERWEVLISQSISFWDQHNANFGGIHGSLQRLCSPVFACGTSEGVNRVLREVLVLEGWKVY